VFGGGTWSCGSRTGCLAMDGELGNYRVLGCDNELNRIYLRGNKISSSYGILLLLWYQNVVHFSEKQAPISPLCVGPSIPIHRLINYIEGKKRKIKPSNSERRYRNQRKMQPKGGIEKRLLNKRRKLPPALLRQTAMGRCRRAITMCMFIPPQYHNASSTQKFKGKKGKKD
jgi:hypothetical protein